MSRRLNTGSLRDSHVAVDDVKLVGDGSRHGAGDAQRINEERRDSEHSLMIVGRVGSERVGLGNESAARNAGQIEDCWRIVDQTDGTSLYASPEDSCTCITQYAA